MVRPSSRLLSLSAVPELAALSRPPELIRVWGELPPGPRIGIVGSRAATTVGLNCARSLASELARAGICVVSGGARGIDAAAHEGALEGGGKTLVVGPLPFERAYPSENRALFERAIEWGGGYLSVAGDDAKAVQSTFFRRNEVLAALSAILVVGESRFRSGARNAVGHAVAQRRPIFVLPSLYGEKAGRGSNHFLGRVARAVTTAEQLLLTLQEPAWPGAAESLLLLDREAGLLEPPEPRAGRAKERARVSIASDPVSFSEDAGGRVLRAIHEGARLADEVVTKTGLSPSEVAYEIMLATLAGRVLEDGRGLLRLVS